MLIATCFLALAVCVNGLDLLKALRHNLSPEATVTLQNDTELFDQLTARYNTLYVPGIVAVVQPVNEADVVNTVRNAEKNNLKFLTQNRGHGWVHMNKTQDAVLIRLDKFRNITVDGDTVTVGGGVAVRDVIPALYAKGRETATGACSCVGFLGATLGGGHGRKQGEYGLMLDNLLSVRLVSASGEAITVSEKEHADLFWGIRGAGHNFGIVTEAVYKTYPQVNNGISYIGDFTFSPNDLEHLTDALAGFVVPPKTNYFLFFAHDSSGEPMLLLNFVHGGPEDEGRAIFKKHLGHLKPLTTTEQMVPWPQLNDAGALGIFNSSCQPGIKLVPYGTGLKNLTKSTMRGVWDFYVKAIAEQPAFVNSALVIEGYSLKKFQQINADSTAYPHRNVNIITLFMGLTSNASLVGDLDIVGRTIYDKLNTHSGYAKPLSYVNYANGFEPAGQLYGYESWRAERLNGLKEKYDQKCNFAVFNPLPYCRK